MKFKAIAITILLLTGWVTATPNETKYIDGQLKIFKQATDELVKLGHTDPENLPDLTSLVGNYSWIKGTCDDKQPCHFGAYTFNKSAFEQIKNMRSLHGQIAEGSDILVDVGQGVFDPSILGYRVGYMTYCSLHGGILHHCGESDSGFAESIVIEYIDKNHIRVDRKAKWDTNMHHLNILPPNFNHDCKCSSPISSYSPNNTIISIQY